MQNKIKLIFYFLILTFFLTLFLLANQARTNSYAPSIFPPAQRANIKPNNTITHITEPSRPPEPKPITKNADVVSCVRVDSGVIREELIHQARTLGYNDEQIGQLFYIVGRESGMNNCAQNPTSTAFGIFQFLDSTWRGYGCVKTADYAEQIRCGLKYIEIRYQGVSSAYHFWLAHKWY
jgi:hypothetical protein